MKLDSTPATESVINILDTETLLKAAVVGPHNLSRWLVQFVHNRQKMRPSFFTACIAVCRDETRGWVTKYGVPSHLIGVNFDPPIPT